MSKYIYVYTACARFAAFVFRKRSARESVKYNGKKIALHVLDIWSRARVEYAVMIFPTPVVSFDK